MTPAPSKVLVVDDDSDLARAYARMLTEAGYSTTTSGSGDDAMSCLTRGGYDCVVSDITMPGMSGIQLLKRVRENDGDLPVVLVTGGPDVETAIEAVDHGAFKYLTKPVESSALIFAVHQAVQVYQLAKLRREAWNLTAGDTRHDAGELTLRFDRALATLWPAFQPVVAVADRSLFAYEALLRTDEKSLPHPGAVLDAAQQLGRLCEVGRGMRDCAVSRLCDADSSCDLFLNLHPTDLTDPLLLDPSAPHMAIANRVVLEITERASITGIADATSKIRALREAGFRIAVDDLGAGYAGLASFVQLEPDLVKLDMCLVRDVHQNATKQRLVRSMTQVCSDMGLLVVAEGVETPQERDALVELGCDLLQGYLFGRPQRELLQPVWG
ncbi:MAG TPA: EAL domain-containing protein [Polyangiaceae bacterium]|nr:EAL domain-containing protein [Polyangiaceae bacterium]